MSAYIPPVSDMMFALYDVLGFTHDDIDRETSESILDEAAKLASGVLAPLNKSGDVQGARLRDGVVKTADGFKDAYKTYCDGGWNAVPFDPEYDGQGLPWALAFPIQEMWQGANMSFGLCPLLNQGAVEAIISHGSDVQKDYYLPKLISGEWTGTMNITEAQAGSDLGLIRSKAEPQEGGDYRITGQKIFITYGDHDMAENIIHLVLARTPNAPEDVHGISMFIVPKFLEDGTRNTVNCIGLEHKLGIHASPTCTMDFDSAVGYLVGEDGRGLKYMFTMMNNARLSVGLQGVAIAERAMQRANTFAKERKQGKAIGGEERVNISEHPDVKRMMMDMHAHVTAGRLMTYSAAIELDKASSGDKAARMRADFLTPIVKSWCTDMASHVTSTGIQVHGGMGFIEETGAAQYYRDARILSIYEGTNGIQASDLSFRKVLRDDGHVAHVFLGELSGLIPDEIVDHLKRSTDKLLTLGEKGDLNEIAWNATPYLKAFGYAYGGAMLAQASRVNSEFTGGAKTTIKDINDFYTRNILPIGLAHATITL
ncbi:MAG: acyl-CoA dehydrogenase [Alphaproteobacteria bacterium]